MDTPKTSLPTHVQAEEAAAVAAIAGSVRRFDFHPDGPQESATGSFVHWDDYLALLNEGEPSIARLHDISLATNPAGFLSPHSIRMLAAEILTLRADNRRMRAMKGKRT